MVTGALYSRTGTLLFFGQKGFLLLLRRPGLYSSRLRGKTRTPQPSI